MSETDLSNQPVFVTGGTGFVGRRFLRLMDQAAEAGRCSVLHRANTAGIPAKCHRLKGDLTNIEPLREVLEQASYVVWFASLRDHFASREQLWLHNVDSIAACARFLKHSSRLKKFIYISSISAVDNVVGKGPITDQSIARPATIYGESKLACESILQEAGLPTIVLRLPFMYGSGYDPNGHVAFWRKISSYPLLRHASYPGRLSMLHIADLAAVLCRIVQGDHGQLQDNQPYLISDGVVAEVDHILDTVSQLFGRQRRPNVLLGRAIDRATRLWPSAKFDYWRPAMYDRDYFTVASSRFNKALAHQYLPLEEGLRECYFP